MNDLLSQVINLKPRLRQVIYDEWSVHGHFPCYVSVQWRGDPTFRLPDLGQFLLSRTDPFLRLSTLLCWPFRLLQLVSKPDRHGISLPVPTHSRTTIRFHTFFVDFYFYGTIKRILGDRSLSQEERDKGASIVSQIVEIALKNQLTYEVEGEAFKVFQFFPQRGLHLEEASASAQFLRLSGLAHIDSDADDTFILLEMFNDFLEFMRMGHLANVPQDQQRAMIAGLNAVLEKPYWKLGRHNQFGPTGGAVPGPNYTGIEVPGGISTWFVRKGKPHDAPDLVVNVNVLRSMLVNRGRWNVLGDAEALDVMQSIIAFLDRNVSSGLFRTDRGHSFYIPEFFCLMFARLWREFLALDSLERQRLDPEGKLVAIRQVVLDYLAQEMNPTLRILNPLDAALALTSTIELGRIDRGLVSKWLEIIRDSFSIQGYPYRAYEIFKGKIPTHMIYGSEVITAALVYDTIDELEIYLATQSGNWS